MIACCDRLTLHIFEELYPAGNSEHLNQKKVNKTKIQKEQRNRRAFGCISQISMVLWIRSSRTQPLRLVVIRDFFRWSGMRDNRVFDRL
jgi:hypothetical protein